MPDVGKLEDLKVPIETIQALLDEHQGYDPVGALYGVSGQTVRRYVKNHLRRRFCWKRIDADISIHATRAVPGDDTAPGDDQ